MHKSLTNPVDTTKSLATRVMDALDGGVEADAWRSNCKIERWRQWYGYRLYLPDCAINNINYYGNSATMWMGVSSAVCGWVCGIATLYIGMHTNHIYWLNWQCSGKGVIMDIDWFGKVFYHKNC